MATVMRFFQESCQSFFLFGPRGTGKSTWLKNHYPDAEVIDLLAPELFRVYSAKPKRLSELVSATKKKTIIIDEVQKIPELLDVVHELIEREPDRQFVLTGSSGSSGDTLLNCHISRNWVKWTMRPSHIN